MARIFYLLKKLTVGNTVLPQYSLQSLETVSEKSKQGLINQKLIRELDTPPVATFEPLKKSARILKAKGIETLADFALAPPDKLGKLENAAALQAQVLDLLHPDKPLLQKLDDDDCNCG